MTILPSAIRGHGYRQEAIDLQPGGATITVTVPSDNPYEMGDEVEVVTQMSGGMAGPDPKMRSKRVAAKGMRQVRPAPRIHAGFLPGMGDDDNLEGDEIEIGLFGTVRKPRGGQKVKRQARPKQYLVQANRVHAGFLPGMGADPNDMMAGDEMDGFGAEVAAGKRQKVIPVFRPSPDVLARGKALFAPRFDQVAGLGAELDDAALRAFRQYEGSSAIYTPEKEAYWKAQVASWNAVKPAASAAPSTSVADVLKSTTSGAADIIGAISKVDAARAERGPKSVTHVTNMTPAPERSGSKTPWIIGGIGALAAVGILAFVLTRKKA